MSEISNSYFPAFDGNGNVTALVNASDGSVAAQYEFGPFGEVIRATGPMAKVNPFRFSTIYQDDETDLLMYPNRPYSASQGRFLCKDPMAEQGGMNVYAFVDNDPVDSVDILGLWGSGVHKDMTIVWARAQDYPDKAGTAIGEADTAVDSVWGGTSPFPWIGDLSYHFNRNLGGGTDSRLQHNAEHEQKARDACAVRQDNPEEAALQLGTALHPLQDWVAHGDFFIKWNGPITAAHNAYSTQKDLGEPTWKAPDDPKLDAVGPHGEMESDGRAAGVALQYRIVGRGPGPRRGDPPSPGMLVDFAYFKPGHLRIDKTEELTTQHLKSFRDYVKQSGGCKCKRYFLGNQ